MIDILNSIPEGYVHDVDEDCYFPLWDEIHETWTGPLFSPTVFVYRKFSTGDIKSIIAM